MSSSGLGDRAKVGVLQYDSLLTTNSTVAIGGNAGQTNQGVNSIAIGGLAGSSNQGITAVAIGYIAGEISQGAETVAIGFEAGQTSQGNNAVAIGKRAGLLNQNANSIALNASGVTLAANQAGLFVRPIRGLALGLGAGRLFYDVTTFEIQYSTT